MEDRKKKKQDEKKKKEAVQKEATEQITKELPPQSGQRSQYDNPLWGHLPANSSTTNAASSTILSGWDQQIIEQKDTESWPSVALSQIKVASGRMPFGN
ncbi:hypothetical protein FQA47_002190 [Oryzias melastigma]|uniref:Uncharacterized protein n=1 Tax=Oryzias melastigma TaxID=30732 RepID=A0A834F5E1_ORYME|nr:hypothetical protein FQA47_002190 [Oryzias melastigma]